jgi:hypothetical protein
MRNRFETLINEEEITVEAAKCDKFGQTDINTR